MLRRQLHRDFRKPLVVFSPKNLLRHPKAVSKIDDMVKGGFQEVIDDTVTKTGVDTVVLTSGKFYYEMKEQAEERGIKNAAFIRLEQLYPLPEMQIRSIISKYKKAKKFIWAQEEPENMGAWSYMALNLRDLNLELVARPSSAAPAAGSKDLHLKRLATLYDNLFDAIAAK